MPEKSRKRYTRLNILKLCCTLSQHIDTHIYVQTFMFSYCSSYRDFESNTQRFNLNTEECARARVAEISVKLFASSVLPKSKIEQCKKQPRFSAKERVGSRARNETLISHFFSFLSFFFFYVGARCNRAIRGGQLSWPFRVHCQVLFECSSTLVHVYLRVRRDRAGERDEKVCIVLPRSSDYARPPIKSHLHPSILYTASHSRLLHPPLQTFSSFILPDAPPVCTQIGSQHKQNGV